MLTRLPFEMRSKIMSHLYLPTIKVWVVSCGMHVAGTCRFRQRVFYQ